MGMIKSFALAAGMSLVAMAASAATLDFTDLTTFTGVNAISGDRNGASGRIGSGVVWTLTPTPGRSMTYNFSNDAPPGDLRGPTEFGFNGSGKAALQASSGLTLDGDGIGASDDEVSQTQSLTLTFSRAVRITGIHVLDLFFGDERLGFGAEIAAISGDLIANLVADQEVGVAPNHGYRFMSVDSKGFTVTSLTFRTAGLDDDGNIDFALAAIDVVPIPLPAGGLLLLTALGGLAAARRRKQA